MLSSEVMVAPKMVKGLAVVIGVVLVVFIALQVFRTPRALYSGNGAKLPCLANKQCPGGLKCSGGFCVEGFMASVIGPAVDMSSCSAKECKGIDAPCSRKAEPCPEGTFCQNDNCVNIAAPNQGEAYNQIGTLL